MLQMVVFLVAVLMDTLFAFSLKYSTSPFTTFCFRKSKIVNNHQYSSQNLLFNNNNNNNNNDNIESNITPSETVESSSQDLTLYQQSIDKSSAYFNQVTTCNRYSSYLLISKSTQINIQYHLNQLIDLYNSFHNSNSNNSNSNSHKNVDTSIPSSSTYITKVCCRLSVAGLSETIIYSTNHQQSVIIDNSKETTNANDNATSSVVDSPAIKDCKLFTCPIKSTTGTETSYSEDKSWGEIEVYSTTSSSSTSALSSASTNNEYLNLLCKYTANNLAALLQSEILKIQLSSVTVCFI